ncbi:putative squalene synthase [Helianthus annuus]|uniref:Squalene synthase n=1 Tax=Helianthus annuus TaxID=4232 RepID=A0A9K3NZE2_HELAN|nr:putative squalene synthase [Helianthus annuus]KAJ0939159.1 putative squalene synthase [Helianthus annuus]
MLSRLNLKKKSPRRLIISGSPLPGVKPQELDDVIMIPKETIDILKDQVFGFNTFFITSQEPYEAGVLFKGNLRGSASVSYKKIEKRLQDLKHKENSQKAIECLNDMVTNALVHILFKVYVQIT